MFVDEIEQPMIIESSWQTADNYDRQANGIDDIEIAIDEP